MLGFTNDYNYYDLTFTTDQIKTSWLVICSGQLGQLLENEILQKMEIKPEMNNATHIFYFCLTKSQIN